MIYTLVEIITVFFECFLIYILLNSSYYRRSQTTRRNIFLAIGTFGSILTALSILEVAPIIRTIYVFAGICVVAYLLFSVSITQALFAALLFCAVSVIVEIVCALFLSYLGWDSGLLMGKGNERVVFIALAKIVNFTAIEIICLVTAKKKGIMSFKSLLPLLPCQFFSIYLCDMIYTGYIKTGTLEISILIVFAGLLYINAIIFVYVEVLNTISETKLREEIAKNQLSQQLEYYELVKVVHTETTGMYHDIGKHLEMMKGLVNQENHEKALRVIKDSDEIFNEIPKLVDTENPIINAILNHYVQKAEGKSVALDFNAWIPENLYVAPLDLSIILGNTIQNAIDECSKPGNGHREISLTIKLKNDILFYEIMNPISGNKSSRNKDGGHHGYGLQNVLSSVQKYNGVMQVNTTDGFFVVHIWLNKILSSNV